MDTHTQKFKVRLGLFITGGLVLFIIAIFIIGKQKNLFNPVFRLTTTFYNVSGLQVGSNIRYTGIDVGTVDNIEIINDSTVRVDMLIRKNVQQFIKADCEAGIGSAGVIGDRILIITQGSNDSPLAKDGDHIKSTEPVETDAIMASLQVTAGNSEIITQQLSEIIIKINSGRGTVGRLIHDTIIGQDMIQAIQNIKKSTQGLEESIEAAKSNIFDIMGRLQVTASNAENFTLQLAEIMLKINSKDGTLGRLIQDSTIALNFNQTMENLRNSSKSLEENMEAAKHNFLLRGYFRKKANEEEKKLAEEEKIKAEEQKEEEKNQKSIDRRERKNN